MKFGTLLFILIVLLIGFGCLLIDNLYTHRDLQLATVELGSLKTQLQKSQDQLVSCTEQRELDGQKIRDLEGENASLEDQKKDLEEQLEKASRAMSLLRTRNKIAGFLGSSPFTLLAALIVPIVNSIFRSGKFLGVQIPGMADPPTDEYVRLTPEERAWVISKRRIERSRKNKR